MDGAALRPQMGSTHSPMRSGVVDLGSNSVRLVVFEGCGRNPVAIFNEKAVLGLGRGLHDTGQLNADSVAQAITIMQRYHAVARAMGAQPIEVLATAAVRDASNGPAFVASLGERLPGVPIHILTGEEEARLSADGVLLGFPGADGILGDIGGGSLELVELSQGAQGKSGSLPIGTIRLADRAKLDIGKARAIVSEELARLSWISGASGRDLYLVGGAWRAMARMHMAQTGYPLSIVHHYALAREEVRDLSGVLMAATRRTLERMPGVSAKRLADLPFAALVLRRLLRATGARRVIFSANGLREGWYARLLDAAERKRDPLLAAACEMSQRYGRDQAMPPALFAWTAPLFEDEAPLALGLREAACWVSDIGSYDHPDYRAEHAFYRVLRQPGVGIDHHGRAFLALAAALRYEAEAEAPFLPSARLLLDVGTLRRAEILGAAFRLAYTLSGGTPVLLAGTSLERRGGRLILRLLEGSGVFAGESVLRRLETLAAVLGLESSVQLTQRG